MKINLNIIKIILLSLSMGMASYAYTWIDICPTCDGCSGIKSDIKDAADKVDDKHLKLEEYIADKYNEHIIEGNLKEIDRIQEGLTKSIARINAMEYQANIDSQKLIFLLRQNKRLYTLPVGVSQ